MGNRDNGFDEQKPQHSGAVDAFDPTGGVATVAVGERGFYSALFITSIRQVCNSSGVGGTGGYATANPIP